jgi:flagellar hook assembly protein FlgD
LPQSATVEAYITDVRGARIKQIAKQSRTAGAHTIVWAGTDGSSNEVAAGLYYFNLVVDTKLFSKVVLMK